MVLRIKSSISGANGDQNNGFEAEEGNEMNFAYIC